MIVDAENGRAGRAFESFLKDEGIYEETAKQASSRVMAFQLVKAKREGQGPSSQNPLD